MEQQGARGAAARSRRIRAVTALSDPARLALYELVARSTEPVSRDAAAAAVGLSRSTVAFHLDRLADEGLVEVHYRRISGRSGPGAGRPAKLYGRADDELNLAIPERHYDLLADLLAGAIERAAATGGDVGAALDDLAEREGGALAAGSDSFRSALEEAGFEPVEDGADVVFGNCPFHALARKHTALVCRLNRALVEGIAGAAPGAAEVIADPGAGRCCVRLPGAAVGATS
ncbi:helix-turn-helix transcriptional regulator [Agromyces aurantiacus]|uniref:Helix-turn-helix transcriptional regulator n=1 Tax=Agromyces aurantiacus TaxID=165814 RepID=A0ABV9RAL7_9MICO|nr:helix-turn-helix domain-containing protein [Agromyces aurantiacus]MBM7505279.1 putative ArsR family transcriptional regulator [Agromyces aurantiacus]